MKITIQEVAKKANVSVATVSRVMNGNYPVKAETKEKVLSVIEELNYIPNLQARELTTKKSSTVGVIVPSINNMFFTEVVNGIENFIKKNALSLVLTCTNGNASEEQACINNLISRNVSGIIVVGPTRANINNNFYDSISKKLPLVFINSIDCGSNISTVSNDESSGADYALNYLYHNNHKNIMFVRGKDSYSYDIKENIYIKFMKSINNFNEKNIINIGNGNISETVDNTMNIFVDILKNTSCTAVFACNDLMAVGVLNACKKLNIKVPSKLSIVGYDNISLSKYVEPKLTTMDQNMFALGLSAAELLLEKINSNNQYSKKIVLNNSLVERETVSTINKI